MLIFLGKAHASRNGYGGTRQPKVGDYAPVLL